MIRLIAILLVVLGLIVYIVFQIGLFLHRIDEEEARFHDEE